MAAGVGEAQPVGEAERHEDRVQLVEAVRAPADHGERQVELGRREPETGVSRRDGSVAAITSATSRDGSPIGPIGPSASRRASHSPTARVCGRRSGSMPTAVEGRGHLGGVERQLAGQHVVEHLAALAEARLDEPPELVLGVGVEAVVGVERLHDDDRRLDRRCRLERLGRTVNAIRTRAWYCTKTER